MTSFKKRALNSYKAKELLLEAETSFFKLVLYGPEACAIF